jgi:hypothetical protein
MTARTVDSVTLNELMKEKWREIINKDTERKNKAIPSFLHNQKEHYLVHK